MNGNSVETTFNHDDGTRRAAGGGGGINMISTTTRPVVRWGGRGNVSCIRARHYAYAPVTNFYFVLCCSGIPGRPYAHALSRVNQRCANTPPPRHPDRGQWCHRFVFSPRDPSIGSSPSKFHHFIRTWPFGFGGQLTCVAVHTDVITPNFFFLTSPNELFCRLLIVMRLWSELGTGHRSICLASEVWLWYVLVFHEIIYT